MLRSQNTDYHLPSTDKELLEECDVDTFRSGGKGGQHVNKTESAVRLFHRPTRITVVSSKERSQYLNKAEALSDLRKKIRRKLKRIPPRIPTRVPESAKRKRLEKKRNVSGKKELRRRVLSEE